MLNLTLNCHNHWEGSSSASLWWRQAGTCLVLDAGKRSHWDVNQWGSTVNPFNGENEMHLSWSVIFFTGDNLFTDDVCMWDWDTSKVATSSSVTSGPGEVLKRCLRFRWAALVACVTLAVVAGAASVSARSKSSVSSTEREVGMCRAFPLRALLLA